jgi:phosphate:Na+ symporter
LGTSGSSLLLNLCGGIALLLWATRLVKTGVLRAFGDRLRGILQNATSDRFRACGLGAVVATALQSSTATALLLVSFTSRGLIALGPALAVMLGADIGSTLVVQLLSFDLKAFVPVLLIGGVAAFMLSDNSTVTQTGRIVIGLALMILSLGMIVGASGALRDNATLAFVLSRLADEPILAALIGAGLTWLMHSSVAMVLLIMTLAGSGVASLPLALALLIGANIGGGLIPLGLGWREPQAARRLLVGNFLFRAVGALVALIALPFLTEHPKTFGLSPERTIAIAHTLFNVALAIAFLPFLGQITTALKRLLPDDPNHDMSASRPLHLDETLLDQPQLALGAASREVMRLAERVETMLSDTIHAFSDNDDRRRMVIRKLDDEVDDLQEAIKLYLTRLTRQPLSEEDARRAFDLILFTTNLEHVGDIIDKNLLELAAKKQRHAVSFSREGWIELTDFHARIVKQMKLAMTVFMTKDVTMARELVSEKDNIRHAEKSATEAHLARLREGTPASIETSALHLDMLRDLKRINAHIVSVAHPILEASGEIRRSRLREQAG